MEFKVVTWNMAHWSHRRVSEKAWTFLENHLAPDVALLQEVVPSSHCPKDRCVWREIGGSRTWGSAIVSRSWPLREVSLPRNDYLGALTIAELVLGRSRRLLLISLYGQMDEHGYSITTLHRMLSDLTHLLHGKILKGVAPAIILGGDLNASVQFDAKQGDNSHRIFFQRLEDFGLRDCQGAFTVTRARTLRHQRSAYPWVNDYIFASESLAKAILRAEVIEIAAVRNLSDHNPVAVTFDL